MVEIDEIEVQPSASEDRILDAAAIEEAAATMTRPSARMHLEALAKKLRKESEALRRVEESRTKQESSSIASSPPATPEETPAAPTSPPQPSPAAKPPVAVAPILPNAKFIPIDRFSFDAGGYNSSHVTLYVPLPSVGSISRELISCKFTPTSFDLIVNDLNGKSYRLFKDDLEKDIEPETSKYIVKADKIVIKLAKVKSEYGSHDFWSELTAKKKPKVGADGKRQKDDPNSSIMNLMKEMYDSGDDNMKKVIGETMMKQQTGQLDKGMGGLDGMDF